MRHRLLGAALVAALGLAATVALAQQLSESDTLVNAGIAQRKAGNYPQSIETLQRAIRVAKASRNLEQEMKARTFLALTYVIAGDAEQALKVREENLAFVRQHPKELAGDPEGDALEVLSRSHLSVGRYSQAAELLKQALAIEDRESANPGGLGKAKLTQKLGIIQFLSGDSAQAEKTLSASLAAFDAALQHRLAAGMPAVGEYEFQVEVIRWLQKTLVAQNRTDEALELAERGRSRAFAGLLAGRLGAGSGSQPEEALKLIRVKDGLMIAPRPLEKPLTLSQMKAIAGAQGSALVYYSVLYKYDPDLPLEFSDYTKTPATDLLMWLIKPTGEIAFRQAKLEPPLLLELVRSARESIGARGRGVAVVGRPEMKAREHAPEASELRQLHRLLIQPIADLLPTDPDARVTFLPQDLLFLVPFAALQDDTGKFMIERHTLATAPSIEVLGLTRQQQEHLPEAGRSALVMGNPTMPAVSGEPLPNLPGAEQEAKAIAALLKVPVLVGDQATKEATVAQMPQARVIHLATHGLLDDVGGAFSSLALAPTDGDQGFLSAREILALRLNAELVVLSACDTGQGKITGDGVLGLSRALIGAGASSVLVSLWAVPDAPTGSLMSTFYKGLESGADKAQALRQAMLTTMKQYPSPVDWAAFTLIGDAEVSKTLKVALASGMEGASRSASPVQATATRYQVFPVPEGIEDYDEWPSYVQGEMDITFQTALTVEKLMSFYRRAFAKAGLQEVRRSRTDDYKKGFTLVFKGSPNHRELIVQGTDMSDLGANQRSVSVRFE